VRQLAPDGVFAAPPGAAEASFGTSSVPISAAAALLFLLPGASAFGQVTLGAWGGTNVSTILRTPADGGSDRYGNAYGYVPRRVVGIGLGLAIVGNWGIQLNVSDSRKGGDISDPRMKATWKHDYLEVSLLADVALDLGEGDRARLHLLAGPALARKKSCQVTAKVGGRTVRDEDCTDRQRWKPFKDHDYGVVGGAEVEFRLSDRLGANLGALYTYGLLDLNDRPDWGYVEKNRNLTLRAGLQASIGRR